MWCVNVSPYDYNCVSGCGGLRWWNIYNGVVRKVAFLKEYDKVKNVV